MGPLNRVSFWSDHLRVNVKEDYCVVTWYQSTDRRVSFRIENLGSVYNRYVFRLW
jgi:hypothetical protein